ncbi:YgfZ/GcvT domain-containing protein [Marinomonas sp. IMCC 4694]|uniref:CAF17-like 4Fe-4S cluster assembly/insertion protein YgfZ n=1 Tax=Marinomonas sp. IMCC 4694 TaxID=2605432 RepID=UPI0016531BCA|nr:folate-binding protein YgfZ [Marinomonas sp. IMCC 4694]
MTRLQDIINTTQQNQDSVAKQPHLGLLRIAGPDTKKFLQGQLTCDLNKLSQKASLYGAICNIKGRIISSFFLVQHNDDVLMLLSNDLLDKTLTHLKKYAVFFKTQLTDASNDFTVYNKIIAAAPSLAIETATVSETLLTRIEAATLTVVVCQQPFTMQWLIVDKDSDDIAEQNSQLAALSILSARPVIHAEQSEAILPQWLNMQSTGGISFTKGCYTGQEIVARLHYKGKSKKQLVLASWQGALDCSKNIVDHEDNSIGQVFATSHLGDRYFAQILLNADPSDTGKVFLDNQAITLLELPYLLNTKTTSTIA